MERQSRFCFGYVERKDRRQHASEQHVAHEAISMVKVIISGAAVIHKVAPIPDWCPRRKDDVLHPVQHKGHDQQAKHISRSKERPWTWETWLSSFVDRGVRTAGGVCPHDPARLLYQGRYRARHRRLRWNSKYIDGVSLLASPDACEYA